MLFTDSQFVIPSLICASSDMQTDAARIRVISMGTGVVSTLVASPSSSSFYTCISMDLAGTLALVVRSCQGACGAKQLDFYRYVCRSMVTVQELCGSTLRPLLSPHLLGPL